jgi:hypothetical protein
MTGVNDSTPSSPLLAALMARTGGGPNLPPNSRYVGLPTRTFTGPDGQTLVYFARRLVPQANRFSVIQQHTMAPGERLDQVAASTFGDPLLSWRLADANNALDPAELETRGRVILITLPEGVPVNGGA